MLEWVSTFNIYLVFQRPPVRREVYVENRILAVSLRIAIAGFGFRPDWVVLSAGMILCEEILVVGRWMRSPSGGQPTSRIRSGEPA